LQPGKGGRVLSPSAATDWLVKECHNRKLTISGGEPLEQREGLMQLVDALSALNFDICLYTGYETEQVPSEIVKNLRYLKTGQYRKNLSSTKRFVGSDNQRFFEIIQGGCTPCLREI
jgi:anaerobic ribonucleoside-triphosphate reductase activating protein